MPPVTTDACRDFALNVVERLAAAGFTAFWAGGCVRDQLLGRQPKDFDVATNATPGEVRTLFGRNRTLAIGQSFGVITVLGRRDISPVEVATFREDVSYSDGRRPDAIQFSHARQDAFRRDFTINGLFFDPLNDKVVDFVEGHRDITNKVLRAIGEAEKRFDEDKLRMLRAIRFAADFEFEIESRTMAAIRCHATKISQVSVERISGELAKMLVHPRRQKALSLLRDSQLYSEVFVELAELGEPGWHRLEALIQNAKVDHFGVAIALIAWAHHGQEAGPIIKDLTKRLKLSNDEQNRADHAIKYGPVLAGACEPQWPSVQPILISDYAESTLDFAEATTFAMGKSHDGIKFCRERFSWPTEQLDPEPLVTGEHLRKLGLQPGPHYRTWLDRVRTEQLLGHLGTEDAAVQWLVEELGDSDSTAAE